MSIALLAQAQTELRRLAVAGSRFAADDFRLKRLIDPIAEVGGKVPVFAKVAEQLKVLTSAAKDQSAAALIRASGLVTAILATQGRSSVDGEFTPIAGQELALAPVTDGSTRRLRPVLEALTTTGSGRLETVESAHTDGLFRDFRLMRLAVDHLEDPYPPVADVIALKVLPSYGPMIVPRLRAGLDLKGGMRHARALRAIFAIEGAEALPLLTKALTEGSADLRVAAVQCLATIPEAQSLLLAHAKDKNQEVRQAVVAALGNRSGAEVIALLLDAFQGKDFYSAAGAIRCNPDPALSKALAAVMPGIRDAALAEKAKPIDVQRLAQVISIFSGRHDEHANACLTDLYSRREALSKAGLFEDLVIAIAQGDNAVLGEVIMAQAETYLGAARQHALALLFRRGDPAAVFARIAPQLAKGVKGGKTLLADLPSEAPWDLRWLDVALDLGDAKLIYSCLRPDHARGLAWLRAEDDRDSHVKALEQLIRFRTEDALDRYIARIERFATAVQQRWHWWHLFHLASLFPPTALPRFQALAESLPDHLTLPWLEAIEPLVQAAKNTTPAPKAP